MTFQPADTFANGKIFLNEYLDIYSLVNGPNYFKVWAAPETDWGAVFLSGCYIVVPNGGAQFTVYLNDDQTRQMANALAHHVVTGFVNTTINGVSIVTSGNGVNVTVASISYTTFLSNDEAQKCSKAMAHYESTLPGFGGQTPLVNPLNP